MKPIDYILVPFCILAAAAAITVIVSAAVVSIQTNSIPTYSTGRTMKHGPGPVETWPHPEPLGVETRAL